MSYSANESLHALSGAYAVDALDDAERAAFEKHLADCHDCQAEVTSLREAAALMADDSAITPPASLRDSVLSGISAIRPLPPQVGHDEADDPAEDAEPALAKVLPMRSRRSRLAALAVAAAVLAAVGAGAVIQPWNDNPPTVAPPTSPADRVLAASDAKTVSVSFEDGSKATVVRSLSQGKAVLLADDMAAPPAGKTFELWLQDPSGKMVPAGLMDTAGDHKILLKGDATTATAVGITVEPEGGSPEPTSDPIALLDLNKAEA